MAVLLCALALAPCVSTGHAYFEQVEDYPRGYWTSSSASDLRAAGDNSGQQGFWWLPQLFNFNGFELDITVHDFGADLRPWSFSDYKEVRVDITVASALISSVSSSVRFYEQKSWFGAAVTREVQFMGDKRNNINPMPYHFRIYFLRYNETALRIVYLWDNAGVRDAETGELVMVKLEEIIPVSDGFFDQGIVIGIGVYHEGSGHFRLSLAGEDYVNGESPVFPPYLDLNRVAETGVDWIRDLYNFIAGGVAFLIGGIQFFAALIGQWLPVLPVLFLLYTIDVVVTSAQVGSVQPVGRFVMTLYEFLLKIWDVLARIAQVIWDAITFWT